MSSDALPIGPLDLVIGCSVGSGAASTAFDLNAKSEGAVAGAISAAVVPSRARACTVHAG